MIVKDFPVLYLDLNSCFATVEQQARPQLRHRPLAITNRLVPNACIIAASYEAKASGVKVGMRRLEAERLCPELKFAESEPSKYIYVHDLLKRIMQSYSPKVVMKSIDEGVIDLTQAPTSVQQQDPLALGAELKTRLKQEIGNYMRCNVGFASNRFLAKLAAELHKPDGLDLLTPENQRSVFAHLQLTDLPGINTRLERRLNAYRIYTPIEFLDASEEVLRKQVFRSIDGTKWYRRLRGEEVDDFADHIKSVGRQYVLESKLLDRKQVFLRLAHLAEDVGYRLRRHQLYARGLQLWAIHYDGTRSHAHHLAATPFNSDHAIIAIAKQLFAQIPAHTRIIGLTLYKLQDAPSAQLSIFQAQSQKSARVTSAIDEINCRFGARTIHSALTLGTDQVQAKLPFGSTRHLDHSIA